MTRFCEVCACRLQSPLVQIVFIIGLAFCFMLAILPVIRKLNVSMKRNRSLLLLLPEDLVTEVPEIQDEMLAYAKSSAT